MRSARRVSSSPILSPLRRSSRTWSWMLPGPSGSGRGGVGAPLNCSRCPFDHCRPPTFAARGIERASNLFGDVVDAASRIDGPTTARPEPECGTRAQPADGRSVEIVGVRSHQPLSGGAAQPRPDQRPRSVRAGPRRRSRSRRRALSPISQNMGGHKPTKRARRSALARSSSPIVFARIQSPMQSTIAPSDVANR